jgi:hypothetical protein
VSILKWQLLERPVVLSKYSVVIDPDQFARSTLEQLAHALAGRHWLAGNWTVRDLIGRLAQVGVDVEVEVEVALGEANGPERL